MSQKKKVIIMGAGPAGLTAAYELLEQTDFQPIVFEQSSHLGGISKTIDYKGNKIDIGGHRFFSKSDRVMKWWLNILPLQYDADKESSISISYQNQSRNFTPDSKIVNEDKVMLLRNRKSRILFRKKLFDYPLRLNLENVFKLGIPYTINIFFSYINSRIFPIKEEKNLEDFFINRFGKKLYLTFFKDYTEKVWGVQCKNIDASWGAQRIKGLSIRKAVTHAILSAFAWNRDHKKVETSLIEKFLYPKYGPGQMWQEVGKHVIKKGGMIETHSRIVGIKYLENKITSVTVLDTQSGITKEVFGDYFISTIPVKELINFLGSNVPSDVSKIANALDYRDFITVGLLLNKLKIKDKSEKMLSDTWLYVQEKDVKVGRIQFFNNWSPFMVSSPDKIWIGLEYFCNEGDELWKKSEEDMASFAIQELVKLDFIDEEDVIDSITIKEPKAYPSYTGAYENFQTVRNFTDKIPNLFLIGRNGMHRYNNQDHSMLTAMETVENIKNGIADKEKIWSINTEEDYLEEK